MQSFGDNYVPSATHDNNDVLDAPKCHPGTRTSFLSRLSNWVKDAETSVYVTWLHGPAGAGKSAIARSVAESLHPEGLLAAAFFFFRTDLRRNSEKPFVPTLAYQIAYSIPETQPHIANAIAAEPSICSRSLQTQFKTLIIEPLECVMSSESNSLSRPLLIIVDGLDEITQSARNLILEIMFESLPCLHGHIKLLAVSRPEYDIERSFKSTSVLRHLSTIGLLGDLQAYEDVRLYLRDKFQKIKRTHPLRELFDPYWPSDDAIDQLVKKSSGYFIYASTVIKFIENDFAQPQKRLEVILHLRTTSHKPYAILDALYLNILTSSRANRALVVKILSTVVLADQFDDQLSYKCQFMKTDQFLETILLLDPGEVQLALLDLKSLVGVDGVLKFWHKSFSDFLLDPSRSNEFYACSGRTSTLIAKSCLRLLSDKTGWLDRCFATTYFDGFPYFFLRRSWSDLLKVSPTRECHYLLSVCCYNAVADLDLQTAMMEYELNVIPPLLDGSPSAYFRVLCLCLHNSQRALVSQSSKPSVPLT